MNIQSNLPVSVLAENPSELVSNKYGFIPTTRIINIFESQGWHVVNAKALKPRTKDPLYVKHAVEFEHEIHSALSDTERFRITVVNSHDASSSFQFFTGLMRLVCSNGLFVGQSLPNYKVRHVGFTDAKVNEALVNTLEGAPIVASMITAMKDTDLNPDQRLSFYLKAMRLVDSPVKSIQGLEYAKRQADRDQDLWTVFNRVQEYIMRGGLTYLSEYKGKPSFRRTRGINAISKQIKINRVLWDLAMSYVR